MSCSAPDSLGRHLVPALGVCPCGAVERRLPVRVERRYRFTAEGLRRLLPVAPGFGC